MVFPLELIKEARETDRKLLEVFEELLTNK